MQILGDFQSLKLGEKEQEIDLFKRTKEEFINKVEEILITSKGTSTSAAIIEDIHSSAKEYMDYVFEKQNPFTFGMAQKWVNMYFKYLWLFSDSEEFAAELGIPTELDMPIDSYIIDALFEEGVLSEETCNDSHDMRLNGLIRIKNIRKAKRPSDSVLK